MRGCQNGWLTHDRDGALRGPDTIETLIEDGFGLYTPLSPAQALCVSAEDDSAEAIDHLEELESYIAFYLHQDLEKVSTWTWEELRRRFDQTIGIIRAQKGMTPRDDPPPRDDARM